MLTITLFYSQKYKRSKKWLMLRIFTINDVEKTFTHIKRKTNTCSAARVIV